MFLRSEYEPVVLGTLCPGCDRQLVLAEGGRDHMVMCPVCDAEPGTGATPADAVDDWLGRQPAPVFLPTSIHSFIVPRHPWVIEVGGYPFLSLEAAEARAKETGETIYCRLDNQKETA